MTVLYQDANNHGARPVVAIAGKVPTSTNTASISTDFGSATAANVKASGGNVFSIQVSSKNAALRYFQIHNKATAPVATDVPTISVPVPAGSATQPTLVVLGEDFFTANGLNFGTGVGWSISTTLGTFTDAATASDHNVTIVYA